MADEHETTPGEGQHVVPPTLGSGAPPAPRPSTVPLAPPLVTPASQVYPLTPPARQIPPAQGYPVTPPASQPQHPSAQPQYPPAQFSQPQHPYSATPATPGPSASTGTPRWVPITVFSVLGALIVAAIIIAAVLLTTSRPSADPGRPAPVASSTPSSDPSEENPSEEPSDDTTNTSPDDIEAQLQSKIDEYKLARDDGSLWTKIPDNDFNRTAVSAIIFFLTDMKVATLWGIDQATADEYAQDAAHLEELLLSEQPLGSDVEITFEDGRVFRYNGDTGEGGYFDE